MQITCPTRHANPFATCWTRPGALPFLFGAEESAGRIVDRLAHAKWRGEIVGNHGSGKSTLLATLYPLLVAEGRGVSSIALRNQQSRLPAGWLRDALSTPRSLVVIDGFEQLSRFSRRYVQWRCRLRSAGLLVTSHNATGLPTLLKLNPDIQLAMRLVSSLTTENPSPLSSADIVASHACHGSNFREMLFTLYDRHECLSRRR